MTDFSGIVKNSLMAAVPVPSVEKVVCDSIQKNIRKYSNVNKVSFKYQNRAELPKSVWIMFENMLSYTRRETAGACAPAELWSVRRPGFDSPHCLHPGGQSMGNTGEFQERKLKK